ncbi:MAG: winged helix-turn-helix domain-containing protein [Proteobacteria bacterium]|nr:winged helix-turn-helix domain-containing protein [Pseudomonadota bacterium]
MFNLIVYLIVNKHKVITRDELFQKIWHGRNVLDATLSNHIRSARNILGDDGQEQKTIKTVHGRGYQFIVEIDNTSHDLDDSTPNVYKKYATFLAWLGVIAVIVFVLVKSLGINETKAPIGTIDNKSIAVLAFLDMSPEQDNAYFSEGMSEEILNKLAQIPELRVISRTSSFYFKDKDSTAEEIGKQLNVSYLLEGSVRKDNDKVRITVQLIDSKTSNHLWSQTYDKTMDDIFQTQDEIAYAVSEKLQVSILPKPQKKALVNLEAYTEYLKAKYLSQSNTRENNKESELIIRKSIALDPDYAPAWQFLANNVFTLNYDYGVKTVKSRTEIATYAINKAIELDPNYAPSYAILARVQSQKKQFEFSDQNMQKALSLDNNNSYILDMAAKNAMFSGNIEQARSYRDEIKGINPKYFRNYYSIGILDFISLDFESAIENFKLFIKHKPKDAVSYHMASSVLIMQGQYKLAFEYANKEQDGFWKEYIMCMALFAAGEIREANILLEKFLVKRYYSRANIARIYASRGEVENSFKFLHDAIESNDSSLLAWLHYPEFRKMHNDSRWHEIVKKMELPRSHWLMQKLPQ